MKIDWKRKLTSRKLWVAIAGLVTGLVIALGESEEAAQNVGGCIMSAASVVAYIVGDGLADSANANTSKENQE